MRRSPMEVRVLFALVVWTIVGHKAVAQSRITVKKAAKTTAKQTAKKAASSSATRSLKLPVEIQGGCVATCCTYGPWRATERAVAYTSRKVTSSTAFTIQPNETVTGLNSVLYTTKPGIVVLAQAITVKPFKNARRVTVQLAAHDTIYVVDVARVTTDAFWWYRGVTYHSGSELAISAVHGASASAPYDVLSVPAQEWWARVQSSTGATGWLLDPRSFSGIGGCS